MIALDDGADRVRRAAERFLAWAAGARRRSQTPGARLFARVGLRPAAGRQAGPRGAARPTGLRRAATGREARPTAPAPRGRAAAAAARTRRCGFDGVWHELRGGRAILRGVDSSSRRASASRSWAATAPASRRCCATPRACMQPTRGRVRAAGRVALLLQNPSDYLVHERVGEEALAARCAASGSTAFADRHPRDLSGGERQRLALAIVLGDGGRAARRACAWTSRPAAWTAPPRRELADAAARDSTRAVRGRHARPGVRRGVRRPRRAARRRRADRRRPAPRGARRAAGTSRPRRRAILGGAGGALTPEEGAALLRAAARRGGAGVTLAAGGVRAPRGSRWPPASPGTSARSPRRPMVALVAHAGGVRGARPDRVRGGAQRQADDRHRADRGLRAGRRARIRGRAPWPALTSNFFFGQGPWTPWQMAAWGATGVIGGGLAVHRPGAADRPLAVGAGVWPGRVRVHGRPGRRGLGHLQRPQPRAARHLHRQGDRF